MKKTDDLIWTTGQLQDFLGSGSSEVRDWAMRRLRREMSGDRVALTKIAVEMLGDEDLEVAFEALQTLDVAVELPVKADVVEALRRFQSEQDLPAGTKWRVELLRAIGGDREVQGQLFRGEIGHNEAPWEWASRSRVSFAEAVRHLNEIGELPDDSEFVFACIVGTVADVAGPVLKMVDAIDDERTSFLEELVARAGAVALIAVPEPEQIPAWALSIGLVVQDLPQEEVQRISQRLLSAHEEGDWSAFATAALDGIDMLAEGAAAKTESVTARWAFALAQALREQPELPRDPEERGAICFSLLEGLVSTLDLESKLAGENGPKFLFETLRSVEGVHAEKVSETIIANWEHGKGDRAWQKEVKRHLSWASVEGGKDFIDALNLARKLSGYSPVEHLDEILSLLDDDEVWEEDKVAMEALYVDTLVDEPDVLAARVAALDDSDSISVLLAMNALQESNRPKRKRRSP